MSKTALTKLPPAWHAEAFEILRQNFSKIHSSFCDATKRAVWFGIFLNEIKRRGKEDDSIPHGEFGPILKKGFPDLSWNLANTYMRLGREVCEKGKIQIVDFQQFAQGGELPAAAQKLIEGKTQQQLFFELKQVDELDPSKSKRGRKDGEGGRPPELKGTIEEVATALKKKTLRRIGKAADELEAVGVHFIGLSDGEITAAVAALERTAKCMNAWLNQPATKRDPKEIQKLWKTL